MSKRPEQDTTPAPYGGWSNYLTDLKPVLEEKYAPRNKIIEEVHLRRFMKKAPYVPEVFKKTAAEFRSPLIWDFVRRCVAIISTQMPVPKVLPIGIGDDSIKQSSGIEEWLEAAYYKMSAMSDIYGVIVDAAVEQATAVWKVIPEKKSFFALQKREDEDNDRYNRRVEVHRRTKFPFIWEHIPTSTCYPIDEHGRIEVMEVSTREARPVANKYGMAPDREGKLVLIGKVGERTDEFSGEFPDTCEFIEYWKAAEEDEDGNIIPGTFIYMVDGTIVKQGYHKWLHVPYFKADANVTSSKHIAERSLSLAYPLLYLQDWIDAGKTIEGNWGFLNGFPALRLIPKNDDVAVYDEDKPIKYIPGEAIDVPGYVPEWMPAPPVGANLASMNDFAMKMFDMVSLNPILNGVIPGADVSGVAAQTMISIAKSIFGPLMNNIARAFNEMAGFMLECIDKDFGVPVAVYQESNEGKGKWLELGPKDIDGYYEVRHTLTPVLPAEQMTKSIWLADGNARGFVPKREVIEAFGFTSPEKIEQELLLDEVKKDPTYHQLMMQKALEAISANITPQNPGTPENPFGPAGGIGPGGLGIPMVAGAQQGYGPGSQPVMPALPPEAMPPPNGAPMPGVM